jgi:tetratricopeptide (TPR) repeat protein
MVLIVLAGCQGKPEKGGAPGTVEKKVERPADNAAGKPVDNALKPETKAGIAGGVKIEVEVTAVLDGKPAAGAKVAASGVDLGKTDEKGRLLAFLQMKPGDEVPVVVTAEAPGFVVAPWKGSFVVKPPKTGVTDRYTLAAVLSSASYVTLIVTDKGKPVEGSVVSVRGKKAGKTDAKGEFVYEYRQVPKGGLAFSVAKPGYAPWSRTEKKPSPGARIEARLVKRILVVLSCLTEEDGRVRGVAGVAVAVDGKPVGNTDEKGTLTYAYDGKPGKEARISLSAPAYLPAGWETTVSLKGDVRLQRYFYPAEPRSMRTGILGFAGNTPGVDLAEISGRVRDAFAAGLFKASAFREVPAGTLQSAMKSAKISAEKMTSKGWEKTPLKGIVDLVVQGSVSKEDKGYLVEAKFHDVSGKPVLSLIGRFPEGGDPAGAAREIAANAMERFPFEGKVTAVEEDRIRINLGRAGYGISKGSEFDISAPVADKTGRITGYRPIGIVKVQKADNSFAWTAVEDLKPGEKISAGDRAVRYHPVDGIGNTFVLAAKGGIPPNVSPLSGANIYLNGEWMGSTGQDGRAAVPFRPGKTYSLLVYKHGYRFEGEKVRIDAPGDTREYVLSLNRSLFKVESVPAGAEVFVDGEPIGKTPLTDGRLVPFGFHTVRVYAGEEYRAQETVMEFSRDVEDRTGNRRIVLYKDFLNIGERAFKAGKVDAAIAAYGETTKEHPDFPEARGRLARIYLDEKKDYESAIREFETVLSLPASRELIRKQYAVMFANLGNAYYKKGSGLANRDRERAADAFAKAIRNLQIARQNMRFFPSSRYDEAVHDTFYYTALSHHKLYLMTKKGTFLTSADNAWREYFDFFPAKLAGSGEFEKSREAARKYWDQIKEKI